MLARPMAAAPEPVITVHRLEVPVRHVEDVVERLKQFLPEASRDLDGLVAVSLYQAVAYPDVAIVAHWRDQAARAAAAQELSTNSTLQAILREANAGEMQTYREVETIRLTG